MDVLLIHFGALAVFVSTVTIVYWQGSHAAPASARRSNDCRKDGKRS
jgi:hypothetical protein